MVLKIRRLLICEGTLKMAKKFSETQPIVAACGEVRHPDVVPPQRWVVTPTCRHMDSMAQVEQRGRSPVQIHLPKGTSRSLISTQ